MSSPYDVAREQGYSDEEIVGYLSKKDPAFQKKYQTAVEAGYQPNEIFQFYSSKSKQIPKESVPQNINRQLVRGSLRAAETVLGAPRALGELGEKLVPEKLITKGAEKIGLKKPVEKGLEISKKYAPYKLFPSSEQVKSFNEQLFGKVAKPKNEWESKADELVSDFTALALPTPGGKVKLLKPTLLALGGNLASDLVGKMGGGEKQKTYAKLGTFLAGSLINPKAAENLKNDLYKSAREAKPADAKVASNTLLKRADSLEKELMKGDLNTPSKKKSFELLNSIRSKEKDGKYLIDDLEEFKRNINELRGSLYEEFKGNKIGRKTAKRNLDSVSNIIDKSLEEYGKENPKWEAFYRPANEVHGAIAQSHKARNFIQKVAKKMGLHTFLPVLGIGHFAGPAATAAGIGTAAALGTTGLVGSEILARIMKSKTLRSLYFDLLKSSLKENTLATERNLKKLEQEIKKED